jgi:transcriptional regulator of arginine metabolism
MPDTAARRRLIRDLLSGQAVESQAELMGMLRERGFAVTQATVSRDLRSLGAEKRNNQYAVGRHTAGDRGHLARTLAAYVDHISSSGNLVVVKTPPGAAQVVAAALDAASLDGVLGTVAGDDTLLVVASEPVTGRGLAHKLEEIGGQA